MRINTNVSALIANHHLNKTDNMLGKSMQRLASGKRLNRAEDDSAAIAIAKRMQTQINSIGQTGRNGNDGVSVVQTAEGALNEIHSMLQRMRELAVQGANGTNSDEDRKAIQEEVEDLKKEIVRITDQTQFSSINLLDGNLDRRSYCTVDTGAAITENTSSWGKVVSSTDSVAADLYKVEVTAEATQAELEITVGNNPATESGTIKINNTIVHIEKGDSKATIEAKIIEAAEKIGATYKTEVDATTNDKKGTFTTNAYGSDAKIEFEFSSNAMKALFESPTTDSVEKRGTDAVVEFVEDNNGIRAGFSATAKLSVEGNYVTVTDNGGFNMVMKVSQEGEYSFEVTDMGTMPIQIGIAEGQVLDIRIQTISLETLSIENTNFSTQDNCESAIGDLDKAISYVSAVRGSLGAYQNRLESAVRSIEVAEESVTSSLSRIEDTDMAEEMTYYTQMNVLTQAGVSVLAQANERPQTVLQLLQ